MIGADFIRGMVVVWIGGCQGCRRRSGDTVNHLAGDSGLFGEPRPTSYVADAAPLPDSDNIVT